MDRRNRAAAQSTEEPRRSPEGPTRRLAVVIVEPLPTVRAGLRLLIETDPGISVVAALGSGREAIAHLRAIDKRTGLLVVTGLNLGGNEDAYWLIRSLREQFPTVAVVACGANSDKRAISRALFVGADGFVDKNVDPAQFLDALHRCAAGEVVMVGPPADWLGAISDEIDRHSRGDAPLTAREIEVLTLAAEGLTARAIGERLGLKERTVTTHLTRIYGKLGVGSRITAIAEATRAGLITSPSSS